MSGTNFVFNVAKGRVASYADLVGTGGARLGIMLMTTVESDDALKDRATVAAITGANTEATNALVTGYTGANARKYVTNHSDITITPEGTANKNEVDTIDINWDPLGGANNTPIVKLIFFFDPTGSSADSACIPLTAHSFDTTPDGSAVAALITTFFRATD